MNINNIMTVEDFQKKMKIRKIILYIIIIIIGLLGWYYASCFAAINKNTQIHLIFDILIGLAMDLITIVLYCLLIISIKSLLQKGEYSKWKKNVYNVIKFSVIDLLIEIIIEFLIVILIVRQHISTMFK